MNQCFVVFYGIVESEATGKVIDIETVARKDTAGNVATKAALADHINRLALIQFI